MVGKMWGNKKGNYLFNRQLPSFLVTPAGLKPATVRAEI